MLETHSLLGLGGIFTVLFVMLGPLKIIGPFARLTHGLDEKVLRGIALRTFVIALVAAVLSRRRRSRKPIRRGTPRPKWREPPMPRTDRLSRGRTASLVP